MKKATILIAFLLILTFLAACGVVQPAQPGQPTDTAAPAASAETAAPETAPAFDPETVHPMLFHVTGPDGQEGYLFGTIHVGDARSETALEKLLPWLDGCDALAVEFDVVGYEQRMMSDLALQMAYYAPFVLSDGTKAEDHMPAELYEAAYALVKEAGLMPSIWKQYNLSMWSQLVEQAIITTRTSYDVSLGMDRLLIRHCYDRGIPVLDVESAELQTNLLAGFSEELYLLQLRDVLADVEGYAQDTDALYAAWAEGDYDRLLAVLEGENDEADYSPEEWALLEDYSDKLLTQRNLGMRDKAVAWLQAGDKVFFAVGAAHLMDEDGLVALLRAAGYTVEQISY